jgi:hypothetical protein
MKKNWRRIMRNKTGWASGATRECQRTGGDHCRSKEGRRRRALPAEKKVDERIRELRRGEESGNL